VSEDYSFLKFYLFQCSLWIECLSTPNEN